MSLRITIAAVIIGIHFHSFWLGAAVWLIADKIIDEIPTCKRR